MVQPGPEVTLTPFVGERIAAPATHVTLNPGPADGSEVVWVRGDLSSRELRELLTGSESAALEARKVEVIRWNDGTSLGLAPGAWLEPGETYAIGWPARSWSYSFRVADPDELPRMARVWPPPALESAATFIVWCLSVPSQGETDTAPMTLDLWPGPVRGRLRAGALEGIGRDCVSWEALDEPGEVVVPPPVALLGDGRWASVEPTPIVSGQPMPSVVRACEGELHAIGPACAAVMDDRVELVVEDGAWWIAMRIGSSSWAGALTAGSRALIRKLQPGMELGWEVFGVDLRGRRRAWKGRLHTKEATAHVVLNEVMSNPSGVEPEQEWIELYNDGVEGAELEGWILEDPGGATVLPAARLASGAHALVVNESYREDSWPDCAPPKGTLIVRVPKLGNQGLSNGGEALQLRDPNDRIVSRIPPIPSPKAGESIARIRPDAPDGLKGSFTAGVDGGTPGTANTF